MSLNCNDSVSIHITSSCKGTNLSPSSFKVEKDALWYTRAVFLTIIMILAILGNSMVLAATWIERYLHQPSKYFIVCLAVADLLVGIVCCPLSLYQQLNPNGMSSIHLCRFFIWIDVATETASIYTLTFISFDRYLKISKPFKYNLLMTTSKSFIVVCVVWFVATVWATLGMFPYGGKRGVHIDPIMRCVNDNMIYYTASVAFAFFVPVIITLVMYVRVLCIAHKRRRMAQDGDLCQTNTVRNRRATFYEDLKNIRMLVFVMGTFVVCWGSFFILMVLRYHYPGFNFKNEWATMIILMLPWSNSMCNPIIYACFDRKYREAFKRLYRRVGSQRTLALEN